MTEAKACSGCGTVCVKWHSLSSLSAAALLFHRMDRTEFDQSAETCSDFRRIAFSFAVALSCKRRQAGAALIASAISQIAS